MDQKGTVCFISTASIWGGGESWQYETILDIKNEVKAVSISNPKGKLHSKLIEAGVEAHAFESGNLSFLNPVKLIRAYRLLRRIAPRAVMFNTSKDFKLFTLPAKWAGVEYILYRRDNGKTLRCHALNKILLRKGVTHFVPCSKFIGKAALQNSPNLFPASKIDVIYNSISLKKWDLLRPAPLSINRKPNEVLFGCIGRLSREKGQLLLPHVAATLRESNPNFRILVAGMGPLKEELLQDISKYQAGPWVELLGFVESNKAFLESIDCLLIPSYWEGLSTVAIEAMALRKPVIAFDVTSNPELVTHGVNGFLAKPYDTKDMASQMLHFLNNPSDIATMGNRGRQLVEDKFCREVSNRQLMKYFA